MRPHARVKNSYEREFIIDGVLHKKVGQGYRQEFSKAREIFVW